MILAALAGVWFALNNYILGNNSGLGALSREVMENGSLVFAVIFIIFAYLRSLYQGTTFWSWEKSNFRNPSTGGFYWINLFGAVIYALINCVAGFLVVFTFQFAIYGNINQGILTSLFGLSSIFSAVIAYFVYSEKLKIYHVSFMKIII